MFVVTTLDELMGSRLVPVEHWVHREGEDFRQYRCGSRAEAEYLCALLNLTTAEQRDMALHRACDAMEEQDAA